MIALLIFHTLISHHAVLVHRHAKLLQQVVNIRAKPLLSPLPEKKNRAASGPQVTLDGFELPRVQHTKRPRVERAPCKRGVKIFWCCVLLERFG